MANSCDNEQVRNDGGATVILMLLSNALIMGRGQAAVDHEDTFEERNRVLSI